MCVRAWIWYVLPVHPLGVRRFPPTLQRHASSFYFSTMHRYYYYYCYYYWNFSLSFSRCTLKQMGVFPFRCLVYSPGIGLPTVPDTAAT